MVLAVPWLNSPIPYLQCTSPHLPRNKKGSCNFPFNKSSFSYMFVVFSKSFLRKDIDYCLVYFVRTPDGTTSVHSYHEHYFYCVCTENQYSFQRKKQGALCLNHSRLFTRTLPFLYLPSKSPEDGKSPCLFRHYSLQDNIDNQPKIPVAWSLCLPQVSRVHLLSQFCGASLV